MYKLTQNKGEISLTKHKPRLTALKRQELLGHLAAIKTELGIKHKIEDVQIVFTGAKKETTLIFNSES